MNKIRIDAAIELGIDFLVENQLDSGEFPTIAALTPKFRRSFIYNSPFITSFVLYSIKGLGHPKLNQTIEKALCFLLDDRKRVVSGDFTRKRTAIIDI